MNMPRDSEMARRDGSARMTPPHNESVVDLLGQLTQQGAHLAKQQVNLVQAEMREAVSDIKQAITAVMGAAVVGIAGLGVLLMALGYFLGDALENTALGTLIVGVATLVLAAILFAAARKKLSASNLKPERSIEAAQRTPDAATGHLHQTGARQ